MYTLKLGWASRNVSTDKPVNIPGQFPMRISTGVADPLFITALVIENGADIVIFVSADLVGIRSGLLDEVRKKIKAQTNEIPPEKVIINATHTHTGASYYGRSGWEIGDEYEKGYEPMPDSGVEIASSDEYGDFLSSQIADAVCEAYEKRSEGGVAYGYGYAVVGHSRRVIYFDDTSKREGAAANGYMINGHGVMYGNTNDAQFSHYEAGTDHFMNVLFTFNKTNELTGAVINIPCPSQCSEADHKLSADYWDDVRKALREKFGDIYILGQCAPSGDLSPRILHYKQAQERRFKLKYGEGTKDRNERKDIAERVAAGFAEIYGWAKNEIMTELPINHVVETVYLTRRLISDDELQFCKDMLEQLKDPHFITDKEDPVRMLTHNSSIEALRNRYIGILRRYDLQKTEPKMPMEMHVLNIGGAAFTTNMFELYMDYMHRIQARSPFTQTFVTQLVGVPGGGGSYLATDRGAENKGYSACMFCNVISPAGGQEMVEECVRILNEIYNKGRN